MSFVRHHPWLTLGLSWLIVGGVQLGLGFASDRAFVAPEVLFALVVIGAGLCVVLSLIMVARSFKHRAPEPALFGGFLFAVSLLPLTHGLLVPGVLVDENATTMLAVQVALPGALVLTIPLMAPRSKWANAIARRWRTFVVAHMAATTALAVWFVASPYRFNAFAGGSVALYAIVAVSIIACVALSIRHTSLAIVAGTTQAFAAPLAVVLIGSASLIFVHGVIFGLAFWLAHVIDIVGVLLAGIAALLTHGRRDFVTKLLEPIESITPLRSLEIGLDPVVHRFLRELESKDEITRDHVVRTARLAVTTAEQLRCRPDQIRAIGIGALLHDIGKLEVPDEILKKPGRLTDGEMNTMKCHTVEGERLVSGSRALDEAAPIIRHHHERFDGGGYPDGIAGTEIPLGARIVAACDAFDAMVNTRHYRVGLGHEIADAVLVEHSGSQWDPRVVDALRTVIEWPADDSAEQPLDNVGRVESEDAPQSTGNHEPTLCCADQAELALAVADRITSQ